MTNPELSPGIRRLRKVVIVMGYILVIGTLALFIAVYFKFSNKHSAPANSFATQAPTYSEKCVFQPTADIEISDNIISSNINNNILTIITNKKNKPVSANNIQQGDPIILSAITPQSTQQIIIFDLCKGEVLSRLNIVAAN